MVVRDGREHVPAQLAFAQPKWRCRYVEHEVPTGSDQFFDRIYAIELPVPEALVVPGILTNGQRHLIAAKAEQLLALGGSANVPLVGNMISGEPHLPLD